MSANFTPEKKDYKILTPFKMQVLTNFPYIEADFDALTNYQLLCKVVEYLNNVIHNENEVTEQITSLYNAYLSLQNYINTYFDNLDVQEEINNKLDEMVEEGTLQEIITDYLNSKAIFCYDSVADMKLATNLINGSYTKTLGYYNKNDGGTSLYKVRTITNDDVVDEKFIIELYDNNLIAELIYGDTLNINQIGGKSNDDTFDNYPYYESLINNSRIQTIKFLKGTYYFSRIILKNTKNIIGSSSLNTIIQAMVSNYSNFISLDYGPVAYLKISNLQINGNSSNVGQNGLYIYGQPQQTGIAHGGIWYTIFENLLIRNFTKHQLYFEGNDPSSSSLVVNQFCTFNNVYCYGNANSEDVVKIVHQQGQFEFNNCQFDNAPSGYYNLVVDRGDCLFNQLTIQNAAKGMYFSGSNIVINKIWVEGITTVILDQVDNTYTYGGITNIIGGSIRNSANSIDTYGFSSTNRSIITIEGVSFRNSCGVTLFNNGNTNNDILYTKDCYFSDMPTNYYTNTYYLGSDKSGIVNIGTNRTFRLSQTQNITDFTFGDRAKNLTEFSIYAHNTLTFEGSKFLNPMSIAKNSVCKIIRVNSMGTNDEKYYILGPSA